MQEEQDPFLLRDVKKRSDERYESWDRMNHAWWAQSYGVNRANNSAFGSPTISPPRSPTTTAHRPNHYRSLCPASRTQAIARGQRELMEMVKNMPEACYELSLKDLVEQSHRQEEREKEEDERNDMSSETDLLARPRRRAAGVAAAVARAADGNGGSSGRGHILKVVFPVSLANNTKKKKKKTKTPLKKSEREASSGSALEGVNGNNKNDYNTAKVSPRPSGGVDEEWWKKRYSAAAAAEGESDGLSSSTGSKSSSTSGSRSSSLTSRTDSNNARNRSGGGGGGCWWFILGNKKSRDVE